MAAPDFFENFLLHDGFKIVAPQGKSAYPACCLARDAQTGGYSANGCLPFVEPWWAWLCPPVGASRAPASVSPHYAGKSRAMPGNSAFHAKNFRLLFLVFFAVFD